MSVTLSDAAAPLQDLLKKVQPETVIIRAQQVDDDAIRFEPTADAVDIFDSFWLEIVKQLSTKPNFA